MPLQAMQYASPKAIWNMLLGVNQQSFKSDKGTDRCHPCSIHL